MYQSGLWERVQDRYLEWMRRKPADVGKRKDEQIYRGERRCSCHKGFRSPALGFLGLQWFSAKPIWMIACVFCACNQCLYFTNRLSLSVTNFVKLALWSSVYSVWKWTKLDYFTWTKIRSLWLNLAFYKIPTMFKVHYLLATLCKTTIYKFVCICIFIKDEGACVSI